MPPTPWQPWGLRMGVSRQSDMQRTDRDDTYNIRTEKKRDGNGATHHMRLPENLGARGSLPSASPANHVRCHRPALPTFPGALCPPPQTIPEQVAEGCDGRLGSAVDPNLPKHTRAHKERPGQERASWAFPRGRGWGPRPERPPPNGPWPQALGMPEC